MGIVRARYLRDAQRRRVYDWENQNVVGKANDKVLDNTSCVELIIKACALYQIKAPSVSFPARVRQNARGGRYKISLPGWARKSSVVLHEASHTICASFYAYGTVASHGPEFVKVLADLLVHFHVTPRSELKKSLRTHKIKVAKDEGCPQLVSSRERLRQKFDVKVAVWAEQLDIPKYQVRMIIKQHLDKEEGVDD